MWYIIHRIIAFIFIYTVQVFALIRHNYIGYRLSRHYVTEESSISTSSNIYGGCILEELGLALTISDSLLTQGRGLFVSIIDEDVQRVDVPIGHILCGYSKGFLTDKADGDKCVSYTFDSLTNVVIYNKKLMTLADALTIYMDEIQFKLDIDNLKPFENMVYGHKLIYKDNQLDIIPNLDITNRYFIPFNITDDEEITISNMGMYCNDLAFNMSSNAYYQENLNDKSLENVDKEIQSNQTQPVYVDNETIFYDTNILQLVWRLDSTTNINKNNQQSLIGNTDVPMLIPTWPVMILSKNVTFTNINAVEIGLEYSASYWKQFLLNESEKQQQQQQQ